MAKKRRLTAYPGWTSSAGERSQKVPDSKRGVIGVRVYMHNTKVQAILCKT